MTRPRVVLRQRARRDIDEAIAFYLDQDAVGLAERFVSRLESALEAIARFPEAGSPRYAQELALPGLRNWLIEDFPYVVFYRVSPDAIDVWRILHAHRDIPEWLRPE